MKRLLLVIGMVGCGLSGEDSAVALEDLVFSGIQVTDASVAELRNQTQRNIERLLSLHPPDCLR